MVKIENCGGSSIHVAINNNIFHSRIDLKTNLQADAVRLSLYKTITLCSTYIPPKFQLKPFDLTNLFEQLSDPFIIMGDFNAHNLLWGSDTITDKEKQIEDVI